MQFNDPDRVVVDEFVIGWYRNVYAYVHVLVYVCIYYIFVTCKCVCMGVVGRC